MVRIRTSPLALPLGELPPKAAERALAVTIYPLRPRFAQTPLPTGEARGRLLASALRIKRYSRPVFWDESSFLLRGATQIRKFPWNLPHLRRKAGCAARRFRCGAPYTPARRTSFPGRLQKPFSKAAFSLGSSGSRYCFRVVADHRIDLLFFIMIRQSRSPRCNPRISISAVARLVAQGTLYVSHRRSVRMMR